MMLELALVVASWYGPAHHGHLTANGEIFNQNALTAAHRTLPFGSVLYLKVGSQTVSVRINDRGPFVKRHKRFTCDLDISRAAAEQLGMLDAGIAILEVVKCELPTPTE